jgi:kynurenine formamidase
MFLLKRFAFAVALSCFSEGAIAQQTAPSPTPSPAPQAAPHTEPWWTSPYGEADTLGAVNNLSPDIARRAARLVTQGKVYSLAVATSPEAARYGNRTYAVERTGPANRVSDGSQRVTSFDERVTTSMGIGTQIDGFGHLGVDHHYYNGITGDQVATSRVLQPADIPPIVTRGVLIDMARHFNRPMLEPGVTYNRAEIQAAMREQGVTINRGDVVLFHTGWMSVMDSRRAEYQRAEPGIGEDGAIFLADLGVVAIGSDTIALEALPSPPGKTFIVHQTLLAKRGVHILETIRTEELARDRVKEFLFVLGVPRMEGTVQMVIHPVAIR